MASPTVYLDHAATTPVRPEVREAMEPFFGPRFGNPSSTHRWGREARVAMDEARERLAGCLGARTDEICFTSGGTEGDNLAILGVWRAVGGVDGKRVVATSPIEHKAVLGAVCQAAREGAEERYFPVSGDGVVDVDGFIQRLDDSVAVCSVMWVNNEIGTIQPVERLAELSRERGVVFHTDGVQAFGKVRLDASTQSFDLFTISGHKICAPKGIGAIFIRRGTPLEPLLHGGSQDRGRRPGTENVAYAVGLAKAAELAVAERDAECSRLAVLRDRLEGAILQRIPDAVVHGRGAARAPHIVNISVPDADAEALLMALDLAGIACSSGSACQSGNSDPSHVLAAMGVRRDLAAGGIRMSLGCMSTAEGIERAGDVFASLVEKARRLSQAAS